MRCAKARAISATNLRAAEKRKLRGEAKAPRITNIVVDEDNKTITIEADGLVHWIYGTDKTSTSASSTRSSVVGIGKTFNYTNFQGSYVRAYITNVYGETCTQPFGFKDKNSTSVENVLADEQLSIVVFPNPVTDQLKVFLNEVRDNEVLCVYDITGKQVMCHPVEGAITILPVHNLTSGIYLVETGKRNARFIKK